jgi:hypothetical protein
LGHRAETIALSAPRHRPAVLSKLRQSLKIVYVSAQQARSGSENPALFLQSRGRDVEASGDTTSLVRFLRRRDFKRKKNKTLACALVAEQSRTIPASSGSTAALNCMAEGLKKISQRGERGEKKKRTKKV